MAYKRISPQPVIEGGTGAQTFTTHGVLVGEATSAVVATAAGTTGQVLTGSTGADPVWASPAASSISITGDSGGALVGAAFTFTGASTGLTFAGAGSTETLGGVLVVTNGGTGRATLTNHGVLLGAGTTAITQLGVATNGQILVGATAADPSFITPTAGSGLSVTTNSTTLSYAISAPVSIANGGTNATSMATTDGTVYFDGTRLVTTATGTSGQVLTSAGAGVAPAYASPAASSISITGDTGGALTGAAFTFTGGTTGLSFGGAGSTETVSGTLVVSNGGTGRATLTNHGVLLGAGTSAITQLGVATNGQILVGATAADPSFITPTAGSGLSVTTNSTTLSYAISAPVSIANGGTNATSMATTDGVVIYDGTRLVTTSAGTAAQVLTSNGAGVAPTFQAAGGGTGNSFFVSSIGGALFWATNSGTATLALSGSSAGTAGTNIRSYVPWAGTFKNLNVYIGGTNPNTNTITCTLFVNGSSTAITISVGSGGTGLFSDTTHTATVNAGDYVYYSISAGNSGTITGVTTSIGFTA